MNTPELVTLIAATIGTSAVASVAAGKLTRRGQKEKGTMR